MDLIIVESPSKAKTITKYLKGKFRVDASAGHIRDLPVHTRGVDVKNNFEPKYVNSEGKEDVIRRLTEATKKADRVYLATDPDREGEAIAWHLQTVLGLDEKGECPIGDDGTDIMISYNHYASGAVGDFLYRRVAGIEALEPGYREFKVQPVLGGEITWAKSHVQTPYGQIRVHWQMEDTFTIDISVPMGTVCTLTMPDGTVETLLSGKHRRTCPM